MYTMEKDDGSKYVLPSGVATSGTELKNLQQKLLQQHYHNNQSPYYQSKKIWSEGGNSDNFQKNQQQREKAMSQYDAEVRLANQKQKDCLNSDLLAQMEYKNMKKQYQRHQNLTEEGKLILHTNKFDSLEREKAKQFNQKYKAEAQEDRIIKQNKKLMELQEIQKEKEYYKNQFGQSRILRSESVGNITRQLSYINPTKQYYYEIQQAMRTRNPSSLDNPESLRRNSSFKITQMDERVQKVDNMYTESLKQHYTRQSSMLESLKSRQVKEKQDLRQVLLNQIRQKQQSKLQKKRDYEIPYTTKDYKFMHHPINNPVDFRHAHDNRYLLGQLKSVV